MKNDSVSELVVLQARPSFTSAQLRIEKTLLWSFYNSSLRINVIFYRVSFIILYVKRISWMSFVNVSVLCFLLLLEISLNSKFVFKLFQIPCSKLYFGTIRIFLITFLFVLTLLHLLSPKRAISLINTWKNRQ